MRPLPALPLLACLAAAPAFGGTFPAPAGMPAEHTPIEEPHLEDLQLEDLRRAWHRCVRQSFSGQPVSLAKPAAERAALAACRALEDRTVAAELAARQADVAADGDPSSAPGPTSRARAWIASTAAAVLDPVAAWFGRLAR